MEKCLYYKSTADDKERIKDIVNSYIELVGHLPSDQERLIPQAYELDFTPDRIKVYNVAWNLLEEMLGRINMKKFSIYTSGVDELALRDLYQRVRAEQSRLSGIFREFEQMGIYVD